MVYTTNQKIQNFLNENFLQEIKTSSVDDLLKWWGNLVSNIESEEDIDEYWNNLTVRKAIERILILIDPHEKESFINELSKIDKDFKDKTIELKKDENDYGVYWFELRAPKNLVELESQKLK